MLIIVNNLTKAHVCHITNLEMPNQPIILSYTNFVFDVRVQRNFIGL